MTQISEADLSAGIIALLQKGSAPSPRRDRAAAAACAGDVPPEEYVAAVEALVQEALSTPIDWSTTSLGDAGRIVAATMLEKHPGLSAEAAEALGWDFTFQWR